jgi:hypothetical protein
MRKLGKHSHSLYFARYTAKEVNEPEERKMGLVNKDNNVAEFHLPY